MSRMMDGDQPDSIESFLVERFLVERLLVEGWLSAGV